MFRLPGLLIAAVLLILAAPVAAHAQLPGQGWLAAGADSFAIRIVEICRADGCGLIRYQEPAPPPIALPPDQEVQLVFENRPDSVSLSVRSRADETAPARQQVLREARFFVPRTPGSYRFLVVAYLGSARILHRLDLRIVSGA